jgi:hypothetical protein
MSKMPSGPAALSTLTVRDNHPVQIRQHLPNKVIRLVHADAHRVGGVLASQDFRLDVHQRGRRKRHAGQPGINHVLGHVDLAGANVGNHVLAIFHGHIRPPDQPAQRRPQPFRMRNQHLFFLTAQCHLN